MRSTANSRQAAVILGCTIAMALGVVAVAPASADRGAAEAGVAVVVRGEPDAVDLVLDAVPRVGGRVTFALPIIDGAAATVPPSAVAELSRQPGVAAVTPDVVGEFQGTYPYTYGTTSTTTTVETGSLEAITKMIGARTVWGKGYTGSGIDIAVIDTGAASVQGLTGGNVLHGPDLSFDSQSTDTRYADRFGHGTHMASIIAGRDGDGSPSSSVLAGTFSGVAPGARVISLKVGAGDGMVDVSQVIAAINWVTEHAKTSGLNIRVLSLSYGSASTQDYRCDPLAFAAEAAWRKGIVVVAAGGNQGIDREFLAAPALNPNLIAVGAADPVGTLAQGDDTVPSFSSRGAGHRYVDLVAPGMHVLGLRVPGGVVDSSYPNSRVGTRYTRGSGTSQAAAVTSGAAGLLLSARPTLTPDQVKWLLTEGATDLPMATDREKGAGELNVATSLSLIGSVPATSTLTQNAQYGSGYGSLEASRGAAHVKIGDRALMGEVDIFGRNWQSWVWTPATASGTTWSDGTWNGVEWTGTGWGTSTQWEGRSWVVNAWTGRSWVSEAWAGRSWVGESWSGRSWVSDIWANGSWS